MKSIVKRIKGNNPIFSFNLLKKIILFSVFILIINIIVGITAAEPTPVSVNTGVTPIISQYPNALALKAMFPFANDTKWKSEVTVYRIWINNTYHWFHPVEYGSNPRVAPPCKKYLFIFVAIVNRGTEHNVLPSQNNIYVEFNGAMISPDPTHDLPTKNPDSTPIMIRVAEIENYKKLFDNSEYVEDFGFSHGLMLGYVNPGESNAVDGYIIYEVPEDLTPEKAYVRIASPGTDAAIWKLGRQGNGNIKFYSPLNNVNIFLNGNIIRNTSTEDNFEATDLAAGTYSIEAKRQGYLDWSKSITVLSGQTTTVTINLEIKKYLITIDSIPPNREVYIDDTAIGKTPLNTEIIPGIHKFKIQAPLAFESYEKPLEINVEKNEINISFTPSAEILIPDAENLIELNRRFKPVEAEYELIKAKNYLSNKEYVPAFESARNASKWAKDVDGDGIANEWDIFPDLTNDYIYGIPFIILLIIGILVLADKHFCKVNPNLEIKILELPDEKRKFKLKVSISHDKQIKSMTCSIYLDNKSIETLDAPGDYNIELGQLTGGTHEVRVELLIIQKRYGKVKINKIEEIYSDNL